MNKIGYYKDLEDLAGLDNIRIKVSNWAENHPTIKNISLYRNKHQAKEYVIVAEAYDLHDTEIIVESFDEFEGFQEYFRRSLWYIEFFSNSGENKVYDKNDRKWHSTNNEVYDPNDPQWFVKFKKDFLSFAEDKFLNDLPQLFKQELEPALIKIYKTNIINLYPSWSFYSKTPEQELPKEIFQDSLKLIYERQDGSISKLLGKTGHGDKNINETEATDTPDRAFIKEDDYWKVKFNSEKASLRDLERIRYIIHLLDNPGKDIHCYRLASLVKGNEPQPDRNVDKLTKEQFQIEGLTQDEKLIDGHSKEDVEKLKKIALEIWERLIISSSDDKAQLDWENTKNYLQDEHGILVNDSGNKLKFVEKHKLRKEVDKARSNVSKQISAAIKDIEGKIPSLADHLNKHIKKGTNCIYDINEDNHINWNIKW